MPATSHIVSLSFQEMLKNPEIRSAMEMSEESKVQASADLADAVYFLHGHSKVVSYSIAQLATMARSD
jgi:hypothetical protein